MISCIWSNKIYIHINKKGVMLAVRPKYIPRGGGLLGWGKKISWIYIFLVPSLKKWEMMMFNVICLYILYIQHFIHRHQITAIPGGASFVFIVSRQEMLFTPKSSSKWFQNKKIMSFPLLLLILIFFFWRGGWFQFMPCRVPYRFYIFIFRYISARRN